MLDLDVSGAPATFKHMLGSATERCASELRHVVRYYFHLHNDMDVPDEEGRELADLQAPVKWARSQARSLVGEMAKNEGRIVLHHRIDIEDGRGQILATVRFGDVVEVER